MSVVLIVPIQSYSGGVDMVTVFVVCLRCVRV